MKRLSRLRTRQSRGAQEGTWAVSYGDMITLLLGFYIMYFSIDPPKKNNSTLTSSLIAALEKLDEKVTVDKQQKAAATQTADDPTASQTHAVKSEEQTAEAAPASEKMNKKRGKNKKLANEAEPASPVDTIMKILLPQAWIDSINEHRMSAKNPAQKKSENTAAGSVMPNKSPAASAWGTATESGAIANKMLAASAGGAAAQGTTASAGGAAAQGTTASAGGAAAAMKTNIAQATQDGAPTGSATVAPKSSDYRLDITPLNALDAEASRIGDRVYIMFPKVSFFSSASTEITPEGRRALEKFSKVYLPFAGKAVLNIVGFSDERPVKAVYRFRDNLELSVLRAVSAQRVAESVGIPLNRTRLMGHGINTQLIDGEEATDAMERWALTRKIMLVIEPEAP